MMSDPAREGAPHTYESLLSGNPSAAPASNVPAASYFQNVNPQPPMHPTPQIWSVPTIIPQNRDPSSPFFQKFLKGKPKALGSLVIVAAILEIGLGIALVFTVFGFTLIIGIPFWGPVFYIIAGSLTIAAQTKPNICLIKGSLTLNIISSIFSMIAVILNIADLATLRCYIYSSNYYSYYSYNEALKQCQQALDGGYAVLSLLLLMNLLIFCVTVSTSVFDCRSLSKVQSGQPVTQVFVIQNDAVHAMYPDALPVPVTTTYAQPPPAQPPAYPANLYKP